MASAAVIAGAEFSLALLENILQILGRVDRKIAIGLHNNSKYEWNAGRVHFVSGTADVGLPFAIPADHVLLFGARKTNGSLRGSVGVITYFMPDRNMTVALMWSVPYDYCLYSNWWNLRVINGNVPASDALFNSLYYNWHPHLGDSNPYSRTVNGWHHQGSMGASGEPIMDVYVSPV